MAQPSAQAPILEALELITMPTPNQSPSFVSEIPLKSKSHLFQILTLRLHHHLLFPMIKPFYHYSFDKSPLTHSLYKVSHLHLLPSTDTVLLHL